MLRMVFPCSDKKGLENHHHKRTSDCSEQRNRLSQTSRSFQKGFLLMQKKIMVAYVFVY